MPGRAASLRPPLLPPDCFRRSAVGTPGGVLGSPFGDSIFERVLPGYTTVQVGLNGYAAAKKNKTGMPAR